MRIIKEPVSFNEIWKNRETEFTEIVKIVVDIDKEIISIDGELHADLETLLLENGCEQRSLWGANLNPFKDEAEFIEFISFINIRPSNHNKSMYIEDINLRNKIEGVVKKLILK